VTIIHLFVCFIDFEKANDSVRRQALSNILIVRGNNGSRPVDYNVFK
jgi:hypothetical protein